MIFKKIHLFSALCLLLLAVLSTQCTPAKKTTAPGGKPGNTQGPGDRNRYETMDTVRWTTPANPRPPIRSTPKDEDNPQDEPLPGEVFRLAFLLPFLTDQFDETSGTPPEKSSLALQFYAGAKLALEELSTNDNLNLVVDVYDTHASDADFQKLLNNPRLDKADVYIGPVRASHVSALAEHAKLNRKILVSPESPNMGLATQNPDFIQLAPSFRAHCEAITRFVLQRHATNQVVLVCKEKEADRLPYFQRSIEVTGGGRFAELIVPDATTSFEKIDLKQYIKSGKTSVFIIPSWSSQDYIMAFLSRLNTIKGANKVEVYGMPQWMNFENIETDYYKSLDVHLPAPSYIERRMPEVQEFQHKFYEAYKIGRAHV